MLLLGFNRIIVRILYRYRYTRRIIFFFWKKYRYTRVYCACQLVSSFRSSSPLYCRLPRSPSPRTTLLVTAVPPLASSSSSSAMASLTDLVNLNLSDTTEKIIAEYIWYYDIIVIFFFLSDLFLALGFDGSFHGDERVIVFLVLMGRDISGDFGRGAPHSLCGFVEGFVSFRFSTRWLKRRRRRRWWSCCSSLPLLCFLLFMSPPSKNRSFPFLFFFAVDYCSTPVFLIRLTRDGDYEYEQYSLSFCPFGGGWSLKWQPLSATWSSLRHHLATARCSLVRLVHGFKSHPLITRTFGQRCKAFDLNHLQIARLLFFGAH